MTYKRKSIALIELIGISIGFGTMAPALINFSIRWTGFSNWTTAPIFPLVMITYALFKRNRSLLHNFHITGASYFDFTLVLSMAIIGLAAWAQDLLLFLMVLSLLLPAIWFLESMNALFSRFHLAKIIALTVFPIGLIFTRIFVNILDHKPIWRSLVGVDVAFDEATAFGVSKFGIFDNALLANQRTYGHTLTHAWAGDMASLTNSPRFMVTASIGFVVAVVGISALVYSVSLRLFQSRRAARISLVLLFVQGSMPEEYVLLNTLRMAHAVSIMWLLLFCYFLIRVFDDDIKYPYVVLGLGAFAVTMSKVHWGLIVVVILAATVVWQILAKRTFEFLPHFMLTTIVFYSTYKFAFSEGYGFPFNFGVSRNFFYELIGIVLLRFFIGVGVFTAKENNLVRGLAGSSIAFAVVIHLVLAGEYASDYWISFAFIWISIFTGAYADKALSLLAPYGFVRFVIYLGSLFAGAWFTYYFFRENYYLILINARSWKSWFVVSNPELISLTIVFLITALSCLSVRIFTGRLKLMQLGAIFVLVAIFFNAGVWFTQSQKVNILEHYYDIELTSDFILSDAQIEMGEWIDNNTDAHAILATNFLCDIQIDNGEPFPQTREDDCLNRNTLAWLASIAHRRVLIESPVYSGSFIGSAQQISDYNTSLGYGRDRNDQSLEYLKNRDVDYFVFDKANSRSHKLLIFRDSLFENIDYAIVPISSIKVL